MAYRYLVDAQGVRWRVWDVKPSRIDRRSHIRRVRVTRYRRAERRVLPTRRVDMVRAALYFPPTESGWLCFESDSERLRIQPYPEHWPILSDAELEELRLTRAAADAVEPGE
jgi:hypothetical protein